MINKYFELKNRLFSREFLTEQPDVLEKFNYYEGLLFTAFIQNKPELKGAYLEYKNNFMAWVHAHVEDYIRFEILFQDFIHNVIVEYFKHFPEK